MFQSIISNSAFHTRRINYTLKTPWQPHLLVAVVHALQLVQLEHFVIIDGKFFTAREEQISWFSFRTRKFSL